MRMLITATALLFAAAATLAVPSDPFDAAAVANRYIVVLKNQAAKDRVASFLQQYQLEQALEGEVNAFDHEYSTVLQGFAGELSPAFRQALAQQHANEIDYIVPDGVVRALDKQDSPPAWGLSRVSQRKLNLSAPFYYQSSAGAGVDVYVIDTGVQASHSEFGGRAQMAANFVTGEDNVDKNGHGSHCAGTIASASYGVAKKAKIFGVKVLNAGGSGSWSGVISGIEFVAKAARPGKTVASMSLGGGKNDAVNQAMTNLYKAGVVAIVASGNNNGDACQISPAGAEGAFAVGATDNADKKASFSNWGKCVKIHAPGVSVKSLWIGADNATNTISGTSMACPHVAGVAAALMSEKQYNSPQEVYDDLVSLSTKGVVTGLRADTVNNLLYNGAGVAERA